MIYFMTYFYAPVSTIVYGVASLQLRECNVGRARVCRETAENQEETESRERKENRALNHTR